MKKLIALLLALTLLLGCAATSALAEGKEIVWARAYDSSSLDPAEASDDESNNIVSYTTEALVRVMNGEVVPGVAESWESSEDGKTFTFHLRQSVFSDGTPITTADFVYSFFRLIDPDQGHQSADSGYVVLNAQAYAEGNAKAEDVGIKALDDYTLEVTYENTGIENLYFAASSAFVPVQKDFVEAAGEAYGSTKETVLGNGPMVITEWSHENRIVLEKNPNYWNAENIHITKLTGIANVSADTAAEMMMTGEIDLAAFSDPTHYSQLYDMGFEGLQYCNTDQFIQINANGSTEAQGRFLSNTNFRRALNYAINREALVAAVMKGQEPAYRVVDPNAPGLNGGKFVDEYPVEQTFPLTTDAAKAQEYLAKALEELGATIEDVPEFSMLCMDSQGNLTKLQAVQDMLLSTLGVRCKIDPQPIQQMIAKVYSGDFDFWTGGVSIGTLDVASSGGTYSYWDANDPDALFGYTNAEYARLLDVAQQATDLKTRYDAIAEIEKIFIDEVPSLLLTWQTSNVVYRPGIVITNVDASFGADLAFADIVE